MGVVVIITVTSFFINYEIYKSYRNVKSFSLYNENICWSLAFKFSSLYNPGSFAYLTKITLLGPWCPLKPLRAWRLCPFQWEVSVKTEHSEQIVKFCGLPFKNAFIESRTSDRRKRKTENRLCFTLHVSKGYAFLVLYISISSLSLSTQQQRQWVRNISFKIKDILFTGTDHVYKQSFQNGGKQWRWWLRPF